MIVDLHSHTFQSDGTLSPNELIQLAHANHIDVFSITDHDTMSAYDNPSYDDEKMTVIPGVEISCQLDNTELHVVGLGVEKNNSSLEKLLNSNQALRKERAEWIVARLIKIGEPDISHALDLIVTGDVICRTHLAKALIHEGIVDSFEKAFKRYLARKGKVWRRAGWHGLAEVIDVIHQAGGKAILAHPTKYRFSSGRLREVIRQFKEYDGDAIELNYSGISPNHRAWLKRIAIEFNLAGSVGSDFHHPKQTWAVPGRFSQMDNEIVPVWQEFAQ